VYNGFNLFGSFAASYSCWAVILTVYNLPPKMCMRPEFMFLYTVILGPNSLVRDNSGVCVKGSTCSEFEIEYDGKLEGVVELQYHSEHNRVFFIQMLLV